MTVESFAHTAWGNDPTNTYRCRTTDAWYKVSDWMRQHGVDYFMLSSGSNGYIFQVQSRHEWFLLRWS